MAVRGEFRPEILDLWHRSLCAERLSRNTKIMYGTLGRRYLEWLAGQSQVPETPDAAAVTATAFIESAQGEGTWARSTRRSVLIVIRRVHRFLGLPEPPPQFSGEGADPEAHELRNEDVEQVWAVALASGVRVAAVVALASIGLSPSVIAMCNFEAVHPVLDGYEIEVGGRRVSVVGRQGDALEAWVATRGRTSGPLFPRRDGEHVSARWVGAIVTQCMDAVGVYGGCRALAREGLSPLTPPAGGGA